MTMTAEANEITDFTSLLVKNLGHTEVVFQWGRQVFGVKPQSESFVLANAVFNLLGDPRSSDVAKSNISTRADERKRVEAKHGLDVLDLGLRAINSANIPTVEVYAPDGARMYTVLEDPLGEKNQKVTITQVGHEQLMTRIAQLEQELTNLLRLVPREVTLPEEEPVESKFNPYDAPEDDDA